MENPAGWGPVETVINRAFLKWEEDNAKMIFGLSLEKRIANALRAEGLLKED